VNKRKRPSIDINLILAMVLMVGHSSEYIKNFISPYWLILFTFAVWMVVMLFRREQINAFTREFKRRKWEPILVLLWLIVVVVNSLLSRGSASRIHLALVSLSVPAYLIGMSMSTRNDNSFRFLALFTMIVLAIEAMISLPTLSTNYGLIRSGQLSEEYRFLARQSAVGDFSRYAANAIVLTVLLVFGMRSNTVGRIIFFISGAIIAICIIFTTLVGSTLVMLIGLSVLFLGYITTHYSMKKFLFVLFIGILLYVSSREILRYEQPQLIYDKTVRVFGDIFSFGIESEETTRGVRLNMSLKTFLNSPFFGVGAFSMCYAKSGIGGHMTWLDQLAEYGIIGFGPYLLLMVLTIKTIIVRLRMHHNKDMYIAILSMYVSYVFAGTFNPVLLIIHAQAFFYFFVLNGLHVEDRINIEKRKQISTEQLYRVYRGTR